MEHQDPNDRKHRNFILDGDYPPAGATVDVHGWPEDAFEGEQRERLHRMEMEGGDLRGSQLIHDIPNSPEMYEEQTERQEYLRACHGGVPDAPEDLPQPPTPFTGMKS